MDKNLFQVNFRGVRGSLPTPLTSSQVEEKILKTLERAKPEDLKDPASRKAFVDQLPVHLRGCIGGNSSCIYVKIADQHVIFDGGSGIRELGLELMDCDFGRGEGRGHLFLSHTHWDHIMGIPFFVPFYVPGNQFTVYGAHEDIKGRLVNQQRLQYFPVSFDSLASTIDFVVIKEMNEVRIGSAVITLKEMAHPGKSYAYRVDYQGKSFVYATDSEYKSLRSIELQPTIDFFKDADLLIFDSQYTFIEGIEKRDWGHSSSYIGVDIALEANVKQLALFHHEPTYSDFKLAEIYELTKKYLKVVAPQSPLKILLAHEGLSIDLLE
jgi:phosphoribosyl 1,2-cyclic phosphodiesterase